MCSNYFAKTATLLPKTIAFNRSNDKTQYQPFNTKPRNTAKTACFEKNNHARFFNMESDDILEVWKQSPNKHTLGFYGIGSEHPRTEAFLFNRLISKCLNKASVSKEVGERRTPTAKRLSEDPKTNKKSEKVSCEPSKRLVLNTPLLAAKVFTMPTVQRNLRGNNTLALLHCRQNNEQSFTDNTIQNKDMLKVALEDLVAKQKCTLRKKPNFACEYKRYKQNPSLYEKALKMEIKKVLLEQDDSEPETYDELYVQLLQCFDCDSFDPIRAIYGTCCRKSRSNEEKEAGEENIERDKKKLDNRARQQENKERYGEEEKKVIRSRVGVLKNPYKIINWNTPSMYQVPNSTFGYTLPSKSDNNYKLVDESRTDTVVRKKQDKNMHRKTRPTKPNRKPFENSRPEKSVRKKSVEMTRKEDKSNELLEKESLFKTRNWRKHFNRPQEPPERQSTHSDEREENLLSSSPHKNDHPIVSNVSIDRSVHPSGIFDQPSILSGKIDRPIAQIDQTKPNDDKTSIKSSHSNSFDMILKQHRNRKQPKNHIHNSRKEKKIKQPVPKPLIRNCPCKICESLKHHSDTTLIRKLKAEKKRRQLCDYYKRLRYFKYIRDVPSYPAPQHKCDPVNLDNLFYCNPKWQQNCDCLNAIQELQSVLIHCTAKKEVQLNLETLKKSIFRRLCNSLS